MFVVAYIHFIVYINPKGSYIQNMAFHECGFSSLSELLGLILFVGLCSVAIAWLWILALDDMFDPGDLDLTALHSLDLIIGFLYINMVRENRQSWITLMSKANNFMLITHEIIVVAKRRQSYRFVLNSINNLRKQVRQFFFDADRSKTMHLLNLICCLNKRLNTKRRVDLCIGNRDAVTKIHLQLMDLSEKETAEYRKLQILGSRLVASSEALDEEYFRKEPACFKYHLRLLLFLYFAALPIKFFNAYGATMTLVLYPIIIYLLFSVVILSAAYSNPVQHPELSSCFEELNRNIVARDVRLNTLKYVK